MTMPMDEKEIATIFSKGAERHKVYGTPLPGGERYAMLLSKVELTRSKKSNSPQVIETYKVEAGEWSGKEVRQYTNLDNEVSWSILLARWAKLGFDASSVRSVAEVEEYCQAITDASLLCQVLVTDQEGSDFKRLRIEAVSKPKPASVKASAHAIPAAPAAPSVPENPKAAPALIPLPLASESEDEELPPSTEDEGTDLEIGMTCEYTFKGVLMTGIVKEFHPDPAGNEADSKITFVSDGRPLKVKVGNIKKIHPKT